MRINVTRPGGFKYAFHGIHVVEYLPGVSDVPQEVADCAISEKWAVPVAPPPAAAAAGEPEAEADAVPESAPAARAPRRGKK